MAINIRKYLNQRLVYWRKTGSGVSGETLYDEPAEARCRWDDMVKTEMNVKGRVITSSAMIMTESRLEAGSLVMLGTLAAWQASASFPKPPTKNRGGFEVIDSGHTPSKKGRNLLFTSYL